MNHSKRIERDPAYAAGALMSVASSLRDGHIGPTDEAAVRAAVRCLQRLAREASA